MRNQQDQHEWASLILWQAALGTRVERADLRAAKLHVAHCSACWRRWKRMVETITEERTLSEAEAQANSIVPAGLTYGEHWRLQHPGAGVAHIRAREQGRMEMDRKRRILLADDEAAITHTFGPALERLGFDVAIARDGDEALRQVLAFRPDLIVLDMEMPRVTGAEVLRILRAKGDDTPVIVFSKYGDTEERAIVLGEGADEYINKPAPLPDPLLTEHMPRPRGLPELLVYTNRLLERTRVFAARFSRNKAPRLVCGKLVLDRRTWRVYLGSETTDLQGRALHLLEYMMECSDEVLMREELLQKVWGWNWLGGTRTVDVHVRRIRRALGDDANQPRYIETVRGEGYRFIGPVEIEL